MLLAPLTPSLLVLPHLMFSIDFPSLFYDPNESNLSYQIKHTISESNTESLSQVYENIHSETSILPSCHLATMTFIVDTPLNISLHLTEPPPLAPIPSHHRFLSRFPDWKGMPQQYSYSLEVLLQPGINPLVPRRHICAG